MADKYTRSSSSIECLPEECIARIISLTSPIDACSSSMASSIVRLAADSDSVWERFLPSDYREILTAQTAAEASQFAGKKELYESLSSSPILIDGGTKTFSIDKRTGKKRYMLGARDLSITWGNNPLCWCWKPLSWSRFPEAVELIMVSWLEIQAKVSRKTLSPHTTYGAYLVVQVTSRAFGLTKFPFEAGVQVGESAAAQKKTKAISMENAAVCGRGEWLEIELGEFYNGGGGGEDSVRMWFRETKGEQLKGGIIVEGIDLKPKD